MEKARSQFNRLNDVFVKYTFFDEERKPLTLSLINSFFEAEGTPTIVDFTFQDREPDPDDPDSKQPRLDVLGVCSDGTVVEIEFQNIMYEGMADRVIFYWSRLAQKRSRGAKYDQLPRVVCINVLGYTLFPDLPDYHNCYMVMNTKNPKDYLSRRLELHFAEIPKWEEVRPQTSEMS
nr:Rpn family recombination-promoting nuclease/putative transposase [Desulfovibrio sp.]